MTSKAARNRRSKDQCFVDVGRGQGTSHRHAILAGRTCALLAAVGRIAASEVAAEQQEQSVPTHTIGTADSYIAA